MLSTADRRLFDRLLEEVLDALHPHLKELLEEVPLVVEDVPSHALIREMNLRDGGAGLCGLYWGIPLTRRSVEHSGVMPDNITIFRQPIMSLANFRRRTGRRRSAARAQENSGTQISDALPHPFPSTGDPALDELKRQIHITVLHEIGHHFGLDEDDLQALGYG